MSKSKTREEAKEAVSRQIERLRAYCLYDGKDLEDRIQNTTTTYFSQRDNSKQSWRTCNTSANAVYLDWLRVVTGRERLGTDENYLKTVFKHGDTIQHHVQTQALKDWGWSTQWLTDGDFLFIDELEKAGIPVVCNIRHKGSADRSSGGHIITIIGEDGDNYILHDSWGKISTGYTDHNGRFARISKSDFRNRSQFGYRTLAK